MLPQARPATSTKNARSPGRQTPALRPAEGAGGAAGRGASSPRCRTGKPRAPRRRRRLSPGSRAAAQPPRAPAPYRGNRPAKQRGRPFSRHSEISWRPPGDCGQAGPRRLHLPACLAPEAPLLCPSSGARCLQGRGVSPPPPPALPVTPLPARPRPFPGAAAAAAVGIAAVSGRSGGLPPWRARAACTGFAAPYWGTGRTCGA